MNGFQYSIFKNNTNDFMQDLQVLQNILEEIDDDLKEMLEDEEEEFYKRKSDIDEVIINTLKTHSKDYCNVIINLINHLTNRLAIEDRIEKATSNKRKVLFVCVGILLLGGSASGCTLLAIEKFEAFNRQPAWFIISFGVVFFSILTFLFAGIHYKKLLCSRHKTNQRIKPLEADFITRYLNPLLSSEDVDEKFHQMLKKVIWGNSPEIQKTLKTKREEVICAFESGISQDALAVIFLYTEGKFALDKVEAEDLLKMMREYNRPQLSHKPLYLA